MSRSSSFAAGPLVALVGMMLTSASVFSGLYKDDWLHRGFFLAQRKGTLDLPWWEMFNLADHAATRRFGGVMPWWTAPDLHVSFFRPLSAATHYADYVLWPDQPVAMHVHSVLWFGALCWAVHGLVLLVEDERRVALVAGLAFAGSYAHVMTVGWVANRNGLLAAFFGVLCVHAYVKWRRDRFKPGLGLALLALAASLLSAELGVSTLAFLVGWELGRDRGPRGSWRGRIVALLPFLALVVVWRSLYSAWGYGAVGSGAYIDPIRNPVLFWTHAPQRGLWLLALDLVPLRMLVVHDLGPTWGLALGALLATAMIALLVFVVRNWSATRIWAIGGLLALLPLVASIPGDRILTFALIAVSPLVAKLVVAWLPRQSPSARSVAARLAAAAVVVTHFVVSPLLLAYGSYDRSYGATAQTLPGLALGSDDELRRQSLVVVNVPTLDLIRDIETVRTLAGRPRPSFMWVLGATSGPVDAKRIGCCTIELHAERGYLEDFFSLFYRGPQRPFSVGDRVKTLAFEAEILEVVDGWRPKRVRFQFTQPLDHPSLRFVIWKHDDLAPWPLPDGPS